MNIKKTVPHLLALLLFLSMVMVYFSPSIMEKKVIQQPDTQKFIGMIQELANYLDKEDGRSAWTGSMFSGMPAYNIGHYDSTPNYLTYVDSLIKSLDHQGASILLAALISFYILMCVMGMNVWLAILGAIAFSFASYNVIIIGAGHITKAYVIAYMPLTISGMLLLFRKVWLWGFLLFTLGVTMSLMNDHPQITYYLMLFCMFFFVGNAVQMICEKRAVDLTKITAVMALGVALSLFPNLPKLYSNFEMSRESLRGPSELTSKTSDKEGPSTGLDIDYAFSWSYSKMETLTLLIPDAFGGASGGTVGKDSELVKALRNHGAQVGSTTQTYTYWGDQPFTSGPVYLGAIVCFLFVLGMVVVPGRLKWYILGGTIFLLVMSWGNTFMEFNRFLFHNMPFYNKFRVPSMSLVIPGLTFPMVGLWGLKTIFDGAVSRDQLKRALIIAFASTGGICLVVWLAPTLLLDFVSALDPSYQMPEWYYAALVADRQALAQSDALRSLVFIALAALPLFLMWKTNKIGDKKWVLCSSIAIILLTTIDLWSVDKRYLNDSNYKSQRLEESFKKTKADEAILADTDPSYRVLNLNNTWGETHTSFFHKSIGGYHAAKLRRYQELIDHRIQPEIAAIIRVFKNAKSTEEIMGVFASTPTLNMLNMRYMIYSDDQPPIRNPLAMGNGWFVKEVTLVPNADAEMEALQSLDPRISAVIDQRFAADLVDFTPQYDSTATLTLTEYKPDRLTYKVTCATEQLALFSEVYYPHGWNAYIDGALAPHFRADWILRAMRIPAGDHTVEFRFEPTTYRSLNMLVTVSSALFLFLLIAAICYSIWKTRKR